MGLQHNMIHQHSQDSRTPRPPVIPDIACSVALRQFVYLSNANILNIPGVTLFD